jgi:hypothetical protein
MIIMVLAEPLLDLWLGRRLDDPATTIPAAVTLVRIMAIGMTARAISDGWFRILYGSGHVRQYAPLICLGALFNPLLFGVLLVLLPEAWKYTAVGWSYTAVFVVFHFLIVPRRGIKALDLPASRLYGPLVRPLVCALVCTPLLIVANRVFDSLVLRVVVGTGLFCLAYAGLAWWLVVEGPERQRLTRAVRQVIRI